MSERYEFFDFGSTESELEVSKILINLPDLYLRSKSQDPSQLQSQSKVHPPQRLKAPSEPVKYPPELAWTVRKKRSVLNNPPSPPRLRRSPPIKKVKRSVEAKKKEIEINNPINNNVEAASPLTPLGFSPATTEIRSKKKSSNTKKLVKEWTEEVNNLQNLKDQLKLSSAKVKEFHSSILNYNSKLNVRKIQIYGEIKKGGMLFSKKMQPQYQFPLFARQQQEVALQQTGLRYFNFFPDPACFPASSGGGMRLGEENYMLEARRRFGMDDKSSRAADARKRRMVKINEKKNCGGGDK